MSARTLGSNSGELLYPTIVGEENETPFYKGVETFS